jgi:hypothetical protein
MLVEHRRVVRRAQADAMSYVDEWEHFQPSAISRQPSARSEEVKAEG